MAERPTYWINGGFNVDVSASAPQMIIPEMGSTITINGNVYRRTSDRLLLQPRSDDLWLAYGNNTPAATVGMDIAMGTSDTRWTANSVKVQAASVGTKVYVCFEGYLVSEGGS